MDDILSSLVKELFGEDELSETAVRDLVEEINQSDPEQEPKQRKKRKIVDYKQSYWYTEYLTDQTYRDPGHKNGKLFRRRFRIPFVVFEKLLKILKDSNKFEKAEFDCCGQPAAPLELLLLGTLRVLCCNIKF